MPFPKTVALMLQIDDRNAKLDGRFDEAMRNIGLPVEAHREIISLAIKMDRRPRDVAIALLCLGLQATREEEAN
ncbi:hypothetical protein ACIPPQ_14575 [Sphingopyxis sp. LARHCG72]